MNAKIHIGTSGWSYKHWKEGFYPAKLAAAKWLNFYAQHFTTTEINGSFYRLPSEETVINWTKQVPDDFLFCPKMSRYLTHMKKLNDPEEPLERFFSVFEFMKDKMGPVLIQLPPLLKFNYDLAERLYHLLKTKYRQYRFVVEVRHQSWLEEQSLTLMAAYSIGFVISQSANFFPYDEVVTADAVYLRLHGLGELYASSYSDDELKNYVKKMRGWVEDGQEVWAYFNNDIHGYATKDAERMIQLVKKM